MKSFRSYNANMSLQDIVMILLVSFLFIIIFMKVDEKKKQDSNIKAKAEFVILVEWPDKRDDDVDTWLKDPQGRIAMYKEKEVGIMHIDRDDRGMFNDTITVDGLKVQVVTNQELTTIRGFIPGEWILNLHLYRRGSPAEPIPVTVTMTKLNPKAEIIFKKTVTLDQYWQELTIARFEMTGKGKILNVEEDIPYEMVKSQIGDNYSFHSPNYSGEDTDRSGEGYGVP